MRSPWKRLNPTEPSSGSEELSIGLLWIMSLGHNSGNKQSPVGVSVWEGWQVTWMAINMGWMSARDFGSGEIPAEGSRGDQGEEITRRPSGISVAQRFRFCTVGTGEWLASSAYRLKFIYFTIHSQYFPFFITIFEKKQQHSTLLCSQNLLTTPWREVVKICNYYTYLKRNND